MVTNRELRTDVTTGLIECVASCQTCDWEDDTRNALVRAVKHNADTDHVVDAKVSHYYQVYSRDGG